MQSIFENLDLRLEDELARYRRQQGRQGIVADLGAARDPRRMTGDRLHVPLQLPPESAAAWEPAELGYAPNIPARPLLAIRETSPAEIASPPAADFETATSPLYRQEHPNLSARPDLDTEPEDYLASSEHLLRHLAEDEEELRATQQEPGMLQSLLTPLGIGSMILLLLSSLSFGYLVMNPSGLGVIGLGATRGSESAAPGSESFTGGVASSNSATAGSGVSPDLSAQEFPEVSLDTLSTLPSSGPTGVAPVSDGTQDGAAAPTFSGAPLTAAVPTTSAAPTDAPASQPAAAPERPAAASPTAPRPTATAPRSQAAAARPRSDSGSRAPSPTAAAPPVARSSAAPAPSRSSEPTVRPSPSAEPTAPREVATAPRPPAIAPTPAAASANRYYVVVDFSGDRSLEQAREVVGDAWVRNFDDGAKVQLGVFGDAASARELAQSLQQQGLAARVYQP
ncbi:MAG: hypothetical protein D6742_08375 [Cyanobacteria bacterium J069]|nr:MAG: hypothetical protein D6742_08375 [Cyanobacteria bacterium J069]